MTQSILTLFSSTSSHLLAPVLAILAVMLATICWIAGSLAGDAFDRFKYRRHWKRLLDYSDDPESILQKFRCIPLFGDLRRFRASMGTHSPSDPRSAKLIEDLEMEMARRLGWLTFMTRVGPVLGLIGTLLPMGPALRSLTAENLAGLANELEIAFMTTIFGLIVGVISYAVGLVRKNWYDQDLCDLDDFVKRVREAETAAHA